MKRIIEPKALCALLGAALALGACGYRDDTSLAEVDETLETQKVTVTEQSPATQPFGDALEESENISVDLVPEEPVSGSFAFTVEGLDAGEYMLVAECVYTGGADLCYLYVDEDMESDEGMNITSVPVSAGGKNVYIRGINIAEHGDTVQVGAYIDSGMEDKLQVKSIHIDPDYSWGGKELLYGGALSRLNYVESTGARFYDEEGAQVEPVSFMADSGVNFARLELYNDPGKGRGNGTYYCPDGFQDTDDILDLAKRASDAGMELELTFMLSDYWTDGIPASFAADIQGVTDEAKKIDILEQDVYDFVKDTMEKMAAQGTVPRYVSIGNEMNDKFMGTYGDVASNMANAARFINAGYKAVKEVSPDSQVVLHISCNSDDTYWSSKRGTGVWFFDMCRDNGVNYDIIGTSYYPFWGNKEAANGRAMKRTVDHFVEWCELMSDRYDKDILLMETAINWSKTTETGSWGQLQNMGAYEGVYDYSPEGQRDYMIELINGIKSVKDGRCIGFLYWDPMMVAGDGIGWAYKESTDKADQNVISNTTWFDFDHKALKVFDAFRYN